MPFVKDGVFYLYYLLDYGHHNHPIVGPLGGHQYALCTSRDLVHWEDHGIALPLDFEKGEASNCTGSIVEYKGKMYALFAERSKNYKGERFRIAISEDNGFHFTKLPFRHRIPKIYPFYKYFIIDFLAFRYTLKMITQF